jgi:hypothetical protein
LYGDKTILRSPPPNNFISNEISVIEESFKRISSDYIAVGSSIENIEKTYVDAISKLKGMLQSQQLSHNIEAYIYEDEAYFIDSYDKDYLTTEDCVFNASNFDPVYNGISLLSTDLMFSAFPNSLDCQTLLVSTFPSLKEMTTGLYYLLSLHETFFSAKKTTDGTEFESIFPVDFFNQYRIFLWDPGIYYID